MALRAPPSKDTAAPGNGRSWGAEEWEKRCGVSPVIIVSVLGLDLRTLDLLPHNYVALSLLSFIFF